MTDTTSPAGHVFVSHASSDAEYAMAFCREAEARDVRCWIAPRDLEGGVPYARELTRAIREARAVVVLLSRAACASEFVLREINQAATDAVPVVALRIEEIAPSDDLAFYIGKDQWIDALSPPITNHVPRVLAAVEQARARRAAKRGETAPAWVPPREAVLGSLSADVRRYLDLTLKLRACLEEEASVLARNGAATRTLLDATLAYNEFAPAFIDRLAEYRASVRKYWGEAWLPDFDYLHHVIEEEIYRGALFRLNAVRVRINALFGRTPVDAQACARLDDEKTPLLEDLQARLDHLTQTARTFLASLEKAA